MPIGVIVDGNGLVQSAAGAVYEGMAEVVILPEGSTVPAGVLAITEPMTVHQVVRCYQSGGWLIPRPVSPVPYVDGGQIVVPPCPAGTVIEVFDLSGEELMTQVVADTDDFAEVIGFTDTGTYAVEVQAPLPHMHTREVISL